MCWVAILGFVGMLYVDLGSTFRVLTGGLGSEDIGFSGQCDVRVRAQEPT